MKLLAYEVVVEPFLCAVDYIVIIKKNEFPCRHYIKEKDKD